MTAWICRVFFEIHSPSIITKGISGNRESIFIAFGLSEDE